eukprot:CAMPEP_0201950948 /NCGR_PEP_ID=MMETSP0903-20130614/56751_1 /ASSEMBLY_ACC=CAM_ASM_000552 /TAXON_ID=420261 /ORGANISM="Thalassiosira antarctica, Strain CCMP982" /LENGTH=675 /DNA_ID=CAMNT_0048494205 /DNA_START=1 /DNA_END=2027 /DNA_ORIENTATION=+
MNGAEEGYESIDQLVGQLEDFCGSESLSLKGLQEKISRIPPNSNAIQSSSFFHQACSNKNITVEIIQLLLSKYPEVTNIGSDFCSESGSTAYPLHFACYSSDCPSAVIELLLKENPSAVSHFCYFYEGVNHTNAEGLPMHYYLSRASNIDLGVVKLLVTAYPEALVTADADTMCTPIHTLLCNPNIKSLFDIVQFLSEASPSSLRLLNERDRIALHVLKDVKFLLDAWPESIRWPDNYGCLPIDFICKNGNLNETASLEILALHIEAYPASVRRYDMGGNLPIHVAVAKKSLDFCKILIDAYPESVKIGLDTVGLPIHLACRRGQLDKVKYLLKLYPESIDMKAKNGFLPIHDAAHWGGKHKIEIIQFLLMHQPDGASRAVSTRQGHAVHEGRLPLHLACDNGMNPNAVQVLFDAYPEAIQSKDLHGKVPLDLTWNTQVISFLETQLAFNDMGVSHNNILSQNRYIYYVQGHAVHEGRLPLHLACDNGLNLNAVQVLFDAYQEAIQSKDRRGKVPMDLTWNTEVNLFLETQLAYARKAKNIDAMTTEDGNGWLPLHHALHNKASLGAIKLLVKGRLVALRVADNQGAFPLHIACEFGTADVVKFLAEPFDIWLNVCDMNKNFPLHYACRGCSFGVVKYVLGKQKTSFSARNADGKLPIQLLCEAGQQDGVDNESP